jgi:beta-phosphoglucomutase
MKKFAVIFDMDGVLVDTNPYHKQAILRFCEKYNRLLNEDELRKHVWGRMNREWIGHLFEGISPELLAQYADEKEALFREIYAPFIEPVAGLIPFLELLKAHKIPIGIGTSAPRANVDFVFEHLGIESFFSQVLDERHVRHGKPHPEIYQKVAEALGFAPEDCIVFEDSLSGVRSGKSAACRVIGITTTHTPEELSETDWAIPNFLGLTIKQLETIFDS